MVLVEAGRVLVRGSLPMGGVVQWDCQSAKLHARSR
jgi:hypothetical protein